MAIEQSESIEQDKNMKRTANLLKQGAFLIALLLSNNLRIEAVGNGNGGGGGKPAGGAAATVT